MKIIKMEWYSHILFVTLCSVVYICYVNVSCLLIFTKMRVNGMYRVMKIYNTGFIHCQLLADSRFK
jgi:hypothetical protein